MFTRKQKNWLFYFWMITWFMSCSSAEQHGKTPLDELIKSLDKEKNFTIILYDMSVEGIFSDVYKHQYKVIIDDGNGNIRQDTTPWYEVPKKFFLLHENDMGMEIASKKDGVVKKQVAPPGYSNYVGNPQYGHWVTKPDGSSFWEFYGQYAMMSHLLGMLATPVPRTHYEDYGRYREMGRPYYGPTLPDGRPQYGTYSNHPDHQQKRYAQTNTFKAKVAESTQRSASTQHTVAGRRSGSSSYSSSSSRMRKRR
ncbi:MAG: hypothetical protein NZM38_00485 [Cytophagales bacterium]|nr:hypothetical protein [Cytophagales bacterium]MDW8383224.1 hypothetical protein [Flammeovirgaceae bacterium]